MQESFAHRQGPRSFSSHDSPASRVSARDSVKGRPERGGDPGLVANFLVSVGFPEHLWTLDSLGISLCAAAAAPRSSGTSSLFHCATGEPLEPTRTLQCDYLALGADGRTLGGRGMRKTKAAIGSSSTEGVCATYQTMMRRVEQTVPRIFFATPPGPSAFVSDAVGDGCHSVLFEDGAHGGARLERAAYIIGHVETRTQYQIVPTDPPRSFLHSVECVCAWAELKRDYRTNAREEGIERALYRRVFFLYRYYVADSANSSHPRRRARSAWRSSSKSALILDRNKGGARRIDIIAPGRTRRGRWWCGGGEEGGAGRQGADILSPCHRQAADPLLGVRTCKPACETKHVETFTSLGATSPRKGWRARQVFWS
jgi:hypothetical protein